jgi:hypothetical protein
MREMEGKKMMNVGKKSFKVNWNCRRKDRKRSIKAEKKIKLRVFSERV